MEFSDFIIFSCIALSCVVLVLGDCDISNCAASNRATCNDQGVCDCGVCKCNGTYSGLTCEECPTCPAPCEIYKSCVGCKIFGTGPLGTMECIIQCDYIATFLPVDKENFDNPTAEDKKQIVCANLNEAYCMESFRIGGMRGGYRDLFVRTEEDCDAKYIPTKPPVVEIPMETTKSPYSVPGQKPKGGNQNEPEVVVAVAGSDQGQRSGDNGGETKTVSSILLITLTILTVAM